jgi:hypothetical protein
MAFGESSSLMSEKLWRLKTNLAFASFKNAYSVCGWLEMDQADDEKPLQAIRLENE